ncbi:MAG: MBL fold metallo-hydrolase, partial [Candidatus Limnocylindrales bacterium]
MELLQRTVGPAATNLYVLGDEGSREAIAVDTATPCVAWLTERLAERDWTLKLIVSTHRHWDHIGDNAAVAAATRARIAVHQLDRPGLLRPRSGSAPFPIPPSVPAVDLAEGGIVRFGAIELTVLHTPGHTEGSVCLLSRNAGLLLSGDTLFAGAWGRTDLEGGSEESMAASIARLARLEPSLRV